MARIDSLGNFLTDVASAIKEKKGDSTNIAAEDFDTEIENLPSGGGSHDWSAIGYSGEPETIAKGYNYAKDIYDNWDDSITSLSETYLNNYDLVFFPKVNLENVTNFNRTFINCKSLIEADLFNIKATSYTSTFLNCSALKEIKIINSSSTNVSSINAMFSGCSTIERIDLSDFQGNIADIYQAFYYCSNLKYLDISGLKTSSNNLSANQAFDSCRKLETIKFNEDFKFPSNRTTYNMFNYCISLDDNTLNSILHICAISDGTPGTLRSLGFSSTYYPVSKIEALDNYQEFIDAGWTIGY